MKIYYISLYIVLFLIFELSFILPSAYCFNDDKSLNGSDTMQFSSNDFDSLKKELRQNRKSKNENKIIRRNRFDKLKRSLEFIKKNQVNDTDKILVIEEIGNTAFQLGKLEENIPFWESVLNNDEYKLLKNSRIVNKHLPAWHSYLAYAYSKNKHYKKASFHFQKAMEYNTNDEIECKSLWGLASSAQSAGNYDSAVYYYLSYIERYPQFTFYIQKAYSNIIDMYETKQQFSKSEDSLKIVENLLRNSDDYRALLIFSSYLSSKKDSGAIEIYKLGIAAAENKIQVTSHMERPVISLDIIKKALIFKDYALIDKHIALLNSYKKISNSDLILYYYYKGLYYSEINNAINAYQSYKNAYNAIDFNERYEYMTDRHLLDITLKFLNFESEYNPDTAISVYNFVKENIAQNNTDVYKNLKLDFCYARALYYSKNYNSSVIEFNKILNNNNTDDNMIFSVKHYLKKIYTLQNQKSEMEKLDAQVSDLLRAK